MGEPVAVICSLLSAIAGLYSVAVTNVSLSTMWAQQERFEDLGYFRDYIAAFGYDAIEVSHLTDSPGLMTLLTKGAVPLSSLHAPTPNIKVKLQASTVPCP